MFVQQHNLRRRRRQRGAAPARALIALAVVAVAAMLAFEFYHSAEIGRLRADEKSLRQDVEIAQARADAALAAIVAPETLAQAPRSVYLIVVNGAARGTAFVIDRDRGLLATAAHTADSLPLGEPGATVTILNRFTQAPIAVRDKKLHAGYGAFRQLVEDYQPIRANSSVYEPIVAPLRDLAFDAGLITVDPIDADTGENRLGPALELADEETLLHLSAGAPIAVIGYPYDTLDDGFAPDAAIARVERGVIAAMTPPLDTAAEAYDPVIANLIVHRLATAGGNSGSPILNAAGKVIGIHTHGVQSTSSNGDGAAQRAEVILDLLSPERESERLNTVFRPAWTRMLTHWARAQDALAWSFYMEYAEPGATPPPSVGEAVASTLRFDRSVEQLTFEPAAETRRADAPDLATDAAANPGFTIKEKGEYAEFWRTVDRRRDHVIFAFDYSLRSRTGFCLLAAHWRKAGDAQLQTAPLQASFELYLPADGERVEDYQIILRRSEACDPASSDFFVGSVSWPVAVPDAQQVSFDAPSARAAQGVSESHPPLSHWERARTFVDCDLLRRKNAQRCSKVAVIELDPPE